MTQFTIPDKLRNSNPDMSVTDIQRMTWTEFAILAMPFLSLNLGSHLLSIIFKVDDKLRRFWLHVRQVACQDVTAPRGVTQSVTKPQTTRMGDTKVTNANL